MAHQAKALWQKTKALLLYVSETFCSIVIPWNDYIDSLKITIKQRR